MDSGKWILDGLCGKGVQANSVHKLCSGIRSDLSLVVDGFRCKRCDGDNPRS